MSTRFRIQPRKGYWYIQWRLLPGIWVDLRQSGPLGLDYGWTSTELACSCLQTRIWDRARERMRAGRCIRDKALRAAAQTHLQAIYLGKS